MIRPGQRERGFILIAAIWLLILAGSIAAVLMLRSLAAATEAADAGGALERKLALEGAIETALADRTFGGVRSIWWLTPSRGEVIVGKRHVTVSFTSESGRLDINEAPPALTDAALRGFGVAAARRTSILERLAAMRTANRRISSTAALRGLLAGAVDPAGPCLEAYFTTASSLTAPRPDQVPARLANALGLAAGAAPAMPEPGAPLRAVAEAEGGPPLTEIVRSTATPDRPVLVTAWEAASRCTG